jgi:hypothetical protein
MDSFYFRFERNSFGVEAKSKDGDLSITISAKDANIKEMTFKEYRAFKTFLDEFERKSELSKYAYNERTCSYCGIKGHTAPKCQKRKSDLSITERPCHGCGKLGHYEKTCKKDLTRRDDEETDLESDLSPPSSKKSKLDDDVL